MSNINVEIAICTWNRAKLLEQTLMSLVPVCLNSTTRPKIILVDNNSTDCTPNVIEKFNDQLNLETHFESKQGHTYARNRVIEVAKGDLLIWIDDDVIVSPNWLSSYVDAAKQIDFDFWGGPIRPVFENGRPAWIAEHWKILKGCFAARDLGTTEFQLTQTQLPYGANFAIRTELQKSHPFLVKLGRSGEQVIGEDELHLMRTLIQNGHKGQWLPNATVEHLIDPSRTDERYIARYFEGQGITLASKNEGWTTNTEDLRREFRHQHRCYLLKRYLAPSKVWLSHLIRSSLAKGQWKYLVDHGTE
ncbi:MAG: glycosyltransferase [Planctomycetota bacterium]